MENANIVHIQFVLFNIPPFVAKNRLRNRYGILTFEMPGAVHNCHAHNQQPAAGFYRYICWEMHVQKK